MTEQTRVRGNEPKSYQELLAQDSREVPANIARRGVTDIGPAEIPTSWYLDPEIYKLEIERLWKRSWQMVCREEDIRDVGDTWVYDVASLSFVIVRSDADTVQAFYNSCLHRGRPLRDCPGRTSQLKCTFHGFTWSLKGELLGVPDREGFPTITKEGFRLPEAKIAVWEGFVFINPDPDAEPFEDYIGTLTSEFVRSPMKTKKKILHVSKVWPANWKIINEAFLEAFHVQTTHPQWLPAYAEHLHQLDVFGNYSRLIIPAGTPSQQLRWSPSEQDILRSVIGVPDDATLDVEIPAGDNVRQSIADILRAQARPMIGDEADKFCDTEYLDIHRFTLFPTFAPSFSPTVSVIYSFKPVGSDPSRGLMEIIVLAPWQDGEEPPRVTERRLSDTEQFSDVPELGMLGAVLNQDTGILNHMMSGLANNERGKVVFAAYPELKIRHFYQLYMEKMGLELPA